MRLKPLKLWQITVILVTIIVTAIGGSVLGVYLSGGFEHKETPPENIVVEDLDETYDTSTGQYEVVGDFKLKITSPTENISQKGVTFKFASGISVERNSNGEISDGIIIIQEHSELGQEVTIKPKQKTYIDKNGKEFVSNAGGVSKLIVETENNLLSNTTITIAVDVPIQDIDFVLYDDSVEAGSDQELGTSVAENSRFRIEPKFWPEESRYMFSDTPGVGAREKTVFYESLVGSDNIAFRYSDDGVYFVAGNHVSQGNTINGYAFKTSVEQKEFYSRFETFGQEFYGDAVSYLSGYENAVKHSAQIDVVEATIGGFTIQNAKFNVTTNKLFTLYAGSQSAQASSAGYLGVDIRDDASVLHNEMIKNVGIRLTEIYAKTDTEHANNLMSDPFGQSGPVRIKGGTRRTVSGRTDGGATEYLLINADVRYYDYAYWEFAVSGEYTFSAEIVLSWQDKDESYKLYTDDDGNVVSRKITFESSENQNEQDISWQNIGDNLNLTIVYGKNNTIEPSQYDLTNLYAVPSGNTYQKVVFFAYTDDGADISNIVSNLDVTKRASYQDQIGITQLLTPLMQSSELIVKNVGSFKLLFATVRTDAYNNPILLEGGNYEIIKYVEAKDIVVNKTLRQPQITFNIESSWKYENGMYTIPAGTNSAIQVDFNLVAGDVEVFRNEYTNGRIKIYAASDNIGTEAENFSNIFEVADNIQYDDAQNLVKMILNIKNVSITERMGLSFYLFVSYDNTHVVQKWQIGPTAADDQSQIMIYNQKPYTINTNGVELRGRKFYVEQELTAAGITSSNIRKENESNIQEQTWTDPAQFNSDCFGKSNVVISDIYGREMTGAQFSIVSSNAQVVQPTNVDGNWSLNFVYGESVSVNVHMRPVDDELITNDISFIINVNAQGVTGLSYNGVQAPKDNLTNINVSVTGAADTTENINERLEIFVGKNADQKYTGQKTIAISPSFLSSAIGQSQDFQEMIQFNSTEGYPEDVSTITIKKDFGRAVTIPLIITGANGIINFTITLNITPVMSTGANLLDEVQYSGISEPGVLPEDKNTNDGVFVYAGYDIDLNTYLKVNKQSAGVDNFWADKTIEQIYDVGGEVIGSLTNGTLKFNDVLRAKQVTFVLYAEEGQDGEYNTYTYYISITLTICPNVKIEASKDLALSDITTAASGSTQLSFKDYVKVTRKTGGDYNGETEYKFTVGDAAQRNNFILVDEDGYATFNTDGQHTLVLGYGETSRTVHVWLEDEEGVIDNITCNLKLIVGISHNELNEEGANSWIGNFVLYGGQKMLLISTEPNVANIHFKTLEVKGLKVDVLESAAYTTQGTGQNDEKGLAFRQDGEDGILVGDSLCLNLSFSKDNVMYARINVPLVISFIGNKFPLYTTAGDQDFYYQQDGPVPVDLAQVLDQDLIKQGLLKAELNGGSEYEFFAPEKLDGKTYSFDTDGILKIEGEENIKTYTKIQRMFETEEGDNGYRLTSYNGKKYLSGLLASDFGKSNTVTFIRPNGMEGMYTVDSTSGVIKLSNFVGENDVEAYMLIQIKNSSATTTIRYNFVIKPNATLVQPYYPHNGNFESIEVKDATEVVVDMSEILNTSLHPQSLGHKRFPDEIMINGKSESINGGEISVSSIQIGTENVGTDTNRFKVTIEGNKVKFSNPNNLNDVIVTIQKTYSSIYGGILTYTFSINPSTEYQYYVEFSDPSAGTLGVRSEDKQRLTLTGSGEVTLNVVTKQRDKNNPSLNSPVTTATTSFDYTSEYVTIKGDVTSQDKQVTSKLTITPNAFIPTDVLITISFTVSTDKSTQQNVTELEIFIPATAKLEFANELLGHGDYTPEVVTGPQTQANLFARLTATEEKPFEFKNVFVASVEIDGQTYTNPDNETNETFTKNYPDYATQQAVDATEKFWKIEGTKFTTYHTGKEYYITLVFIYSQKDTAENVGYAMHRFKVNKSLTFETDTLSVNSLAAEGYKASDTIYGGIETFVPWQAIFSHNTKDSFDGAFTNETFTASTSNSEITSVSYGNKNSAYGLALTPKDVASEVQIEFTVTFTYKAGSYTFSENVRFTVAVSPRATITHNYPQFVEDDKAVEYESVQSSDTDEAINWSASAPFAEQARLTGSLIGEYGESASTTLTLSDITVSIISISNAQVKPAGGDWGVTFSDVKANQHLLIKLTGGATAGQVTFGLTYHGAYTEYTVYVVNKLITSKVNATIFTKFSSGNAGMAEEELYADLVSENDLFELDRLLELKVDGSAVDGTVAEIYLVNDDKEETETWTEKRLTAFTVKSEYRGNTIYVDWGGKLGSDGKATNDIKNAFNGSGKAHIEFRSENGGVLGGITAVRLAGRVEFSYSTQNGSVIITKGLTVSSNFATAEKDTGGTKKQEFTVAVQYQIGTGSKENATNYKFIRKADVEVLNEYDLENKKAITIVANYMYRASQGAYAYSFIEQAGVVHASTGLPITEDDIVSNNITLDLKVVNVKTEYAQDARYQTYSEGKPFQFHTSNNREYMTFDDISHVNDDRTSSIVYDFVVFGEGCANDGDYVLTRFTYTPSSGVPFSFLVAFYIVPGYQISVNGSQIVGATYLKSQPDSNEASGLTSNENNVYTFVPQPKEGGKEPEANTLSVATSDVSKTIVSITRPLWNNYEIAPSWNVTMLTNEGGTYNVSTTMAKLGLNLENGNDTWGLSGGIYTLKEKTGEEKGKYDATFVTTEVIFGEKLYLIHFVDDFGYRFDFYFKLLPYESQNPSVAGSSSATFVEGEKFDVGAIFTELTPGEFKKHDTDSYDETTDKQEFEVQPNKLPQPEMSSIKRFIIQGVKAYGLSSSNYSGEDNKSVQAGQLPEGYNTVPTLHNVTISEIWFNYTGEYGSARAKITEIANVPYLKKDNVKKGINETITFEGTDFVVESLRKGSSESNVTLVTSFAVDMSGDKSFTYLGKKFIIEMDDDDSTIKSIKSDDSNVKLFENEPLAVGGTKEITKFGNTTPTVIFNSLVANTATITIRLSSSGSATEITVNYLSDKSDKFTIAEDSGQYLATDDLTYPDTDAADDTRIYHTVQSKYTVPTMPGWIYGDSKTVTASVQITLKYDNGTEEETATLTPFSITLSRKADFSSKGRVVIDGEKFKLDNYINVTNGSGKEYFDDTLAVTVPGNGAVVNVKVTLNEEGAVHSDSGNIIETAPEIGWTTDREVSFSRSTGTVSQTYYSSGQYNMSLSDMQGRAISDKTTITVEVESSSQEAMISYGGVWLKTDNKVGDVYKLNSTLSSNNCINLKASAADNGTNNDLTTSSGMASGAKIENGVLTFKPAKITNDVLYLEDSGIMVTDAKSHSITKSYVIKTNGTYYKYTHTYDIARKYSFFNDGLGQETILRLYSGDYTSITSDTTDYKIEIDEWGQSAKLYQADTTKTEITQASNGKTLSELQSDNSIYFKIGDSQDGKDCSSAYFSGTDLHTGPDYTPSNEQYILVNVYIKASGGPFTSFGKESTSDILIGYFRIILYNEAAPKA